MYWQKAVELCGIGKWGIFLSGKTGLIKTCWRDMIMIWIAILCIWKLSIDAFMLIEMKLQMTQKNVVGFFRYWNLFSNYFITMESTAASFPLFTGLCSALISKPTNLLSCEFVLGWTLPMPCVQSRRSSCADVWCPVAVGHLGQSSRAMIAWQQAIWALLGAVPGSRFAWFIWHLLVLNVEELLTVTFCWGLFKLLH